MAATGSASVIALRNPEGWQVVGVGDAPAGHARADPNPGSDTTRLFTERLREFFGDTIAERVIREVGLDSPSRGALDASRVRAALDMAAASRSAFAGVNFASRHALCARRLSPQFRNVCVALGVVPETLADSVRERADTLFVARFEEARDRDRRCVDLPDARNLMAAALRAALVSPL